MNFGMITLNRNMEIRQGYVDSDSFIIYIETEDFYDDIANDVERWYDTSNYSENDKRPFPIVKNKKALVFFKGELGGWILTKFVALREKVYAYLKEDGREHKKAKGTNKCIIKRELTFKNYRNLLLNDKIILKSQQRFKSDHHRIYTEVNKIALSSNDDKKLWKFDEITTYSYGTSAFRVCGSEMLARKKVIPIKLYYNEI